MLNVNELFLSFEGEGLEMGRRKFFLRLSGCNLNCPYCDTEHGWKKEWEEDDLARFLAEQGRKERVRSISLTGGEPLLQHQGLLRLIKSLPSDFELSLETNGTLFQELEQMKRLDFISLDIKIPSTAGRECWAESGKFIRVVRKKRWRYQSKVIVDKTTSIEEVISAAKLSRDNLIIQPVFKTRYTLPEKRWFSLLYYGASRYARHVRLLPQMHKYFGVR